MILFDDIIQLLVLSEPTGLREGSVLLEDVESHGVYGVFIDRDHPRRARMGGLEHLAEEALSRIAYG
jgi:hypothetical protein